MTPSQIFFSLTLLIVGIVYVRRLLLKRTITHYDAATVKAKLKANEKIMLLDVRTSGERNRRQIPGSRHIPLQELTARINEMNPFKDSEIICYCQSGNRSLSAAHTLMRHGFHVANLSGGISAWT